MAMKQFHVVFTKLLNGAVHGAGVGGAWWALAIGSRGVEGRGRASFETRVCPGGLSGLAGSNPAYAIIIQPEKE